MFFSIKNYDVCFPFIVFVTVQTCSLFLLTLLDKYVYLSYYLLLILYKHAHLSFFFGLFLIASLKFIMYFDLLDDQITS